MCDAAPGGIPRPDPILEPERYEAWLQVTQHIQSGDKNTASFSGLQNAAGNGIKGHITDAGGLKLGDCHLYPLGACMKGDKCPHVHNRKRFGHLYNADGLPKVKPIAVDDGRSVPRYSGQRDRRAPSPRRRRGVVAAKPRGGCASTPQSRRGCVDAAGLRRDFDVLWRRCVRRGAPQGGALFARGGIL